MPNRADSIASVIFEAKERAGAAQDAAPALLTKVSIWFEMEARTAYLRGLMRLLEPGIDEDCRISGCGNHGRSII